ncbi:hypothetical protein PJ15_3435 [Acinetobacter sp. neg1]|nr:hypothetical protein PJ15_3435 [Acinetobacter sp. neg1]
MIFTPKLNKKFKKKYETRKRHSQPEQAKATKALAKRKKSCNED